MVKQAMVIHIRLNIFSRKKEIISSFLYALLHIRVLFT